MDKRTNQFLAIVIIITGILGLILGLTGTIGVWVARPYAYQGLDDGLTTAQSTIETSLEIMQVTSQALGSTVKSLRALEDMIEATSATVAKTKPIVEKINDVIGGTLPATLEAARKSMEFAQRGAWVIDNTIESLENFREKVRRVPFVGDVLGPVEEKPTTQDGQPLHESLGEVVKNLETMPESLGVVSGNLDQADDELWAIEESLNEMATNVNEITTSLERYQEMVDRVETRLKTCCRL
jgi:chromosome segregation ATPase